MGPKNAKGRSKNDVELAGYGGFPGYTGRPAKAIAFGEALGDEYMKYILQVKVNAAAMAMSLTERGYEIISGGTDNHLILIDLRNKNISGKAAENALVAAEITVNKNMVPFDDKSPFVTSGIRVGTAAITTRGMKEKHMDEIVELIDMVIKDHENEHTLKKVKKEVHKLMEKYPLYKD